MTTALRPYPAYRDSGVPWLGQIPAGWEVRRNGRLFQQRNETGFGQLPILEVSLKTGVRVREFDAAARKQVLSDKEKYKRARQGDIAYNMMRLWQGAAGVAPVDGLVSPAYVVAKPVAGTNARYFEYLLRTDAYKTEVNKFSRGIVSDRNRLYWEDFKQMPSPVPPADEQAAIVRFLGHFDGLVARYIRGKQKLIALLNEQKQAIIHRAVTRGLDPTVALKPSGVDWLGDMPEHWVIAPLKRYWRIRDCKHLTVPFVPDGIPLASVREVRGFEVDLSTARRTTEEWFNLLVEGGRQPRHGDLIYCRNVSVGSCALVTTDQRFALGQDVCLIRSDTQSQRYLNYFLHSPTMTRQMAILKVGSTFDRVNVEDIEALTIVVPPRPEQDALASHFDDAALKTQVALQAAQRQIAIVRDYRTRLIADVVTGELDVREAAVGLATNDVGEAPQPESTADAAGLEYEGESAGLDDDCLAVADEA